MTIPFERYLSSKFALDERSLNPRVRQLFETSLRARPGARILDLGAGLGAGFERLLAVPFVGDFDLTALDRDAGLLTQALERAARLLVSRGFQVEASALGLVARDSSRLIRYRVVAGDLFDFMAEPPFDVILAHCVMDLLPPGRLVERLADWLAPQGLFYAALVYDGETTLLPYDPDDLFEMALLEAYDRSMSRQLGGYPTGGSLSGRQLHAHLLSAGLDVLALGASDWSLGPVAGAYSEDEAVCLKALLEMMYQEGLRTTALDPESCRRWAERRRLDLDRRQLALVVHQLDVLAARPVRASFSS